ncbi:TonB-dependent receptor domain-containing protein [Halomonas sp. IOP_31]|uniref:TonB-dependent receptor domain-containing protein n=1 Tax=Halomonas sp. IOP_31 TaxID=2876584 RepID=UPI001E4E0CF1|nr:TonB-dependent receptor [Halomonas sp. IOP_31]MCD6007692.1 TonB-dependent receptor [Halomonas sp. IOP_31]
MHYQNHSLWLAVGLATAAPLLNTAQAEQRLNTVQVTANRLPQSQADVMASTTVIERAEIERLQASSVVELLQGRAGIELTQNGAPGAQSSLFLRGSESDQTLILVDGVRINSAASGGASLEFLPPAAIERIEIVRGPRAAAYGADAIGGVIQIFTRDARATGTQASLSARAGSDDSYRQNARFAIGDADTRLDATLFRRDGDGFNATRADTSGERDGFEREGGQLGLSQRFNDRLDFSFNALRQNIDTEYDDCYPAGAPGASQDCRTKGYLQTFGGQLDVALEPDWNMILTAGHFDEQREERYAGDRNSRTASHRNELGVQHRFTRTNGVDVLGLDYREERLDYDDYAYGSQYQKDSRENYGLYAMVQRQYGAHELSASLRYDDDSRFGDETTGNLGYAYRLTQFQRIGVSYGTAFKAPNLIDLYGPYGTNPDLDAETSKTLEAFWALNRGPWDARVTAFESRIDDLISYDAATYIPYNVDESRIRGVELSGGWQQAGLSLRASLTYQDPENRDTGDRLKRRARIFARLDADYRFAAWSLGTTLRAAGDRRDTQFSFPYGDTTTAGYGVVDLRTAWQVTPMIELSAKLENALDKRYQLVDGYTTQDRYIEGGITLRL